MTINFLNIFQVLIGIALVGFILIQRGPGATAGSAFGAGASGTVFGAKGSSSFLTKTTALLATAFFIVTLMIAIDSRTQYTGSKQQDNQDLGVIGSADGDSAQALTVPDESADNQTKPVTSGETATETPTTVEKNVVEPVKEAANEAKDTLIEVKQAAVEKADQITEKVKSETEQISEKVKNEAEQVAEKVKAKADQTAEKAKQKIDQAVQQAETKGEG